MNKNMIMSIAYGGIAGAIIGAIYLALTWPAAPAQKAEAFAQAVQCMQTAEAKSKAGGPDQARWEQQGAACKRTVINAQRRALEGA